MAGEFVYWQLENKIALVTVNNPPFNALSMEVIEGLCETLERLSMDESVAAVIITGSGKAFIAGADITMFESFIGDRQRGREVVKQFQNCFTRIENFPSIVIAAVNGAALGGGCELAAACDVRIAAENAQFGVPEVRLGIMPGADGSNAKR